MSASYDQDAITYFAETDFRNQKTRFGIKARDRTRHMYVIGKSGVGKSTLLENMAIQDIQNGEGIAVLDPHGSFAEKMLEYIPAERIKDVVYFAPFDTDFPISFNVLEDVGHDKRHLVASGLMSSFKKIWVDAWSARMEYILNNILLALLEYPDATLLGVNRMLSDKTFRNKVVENISDPSVKAFWTDEFAKYGDRYMQEAGAAIQNKIGQFTANPLVRNIIGQSKSSFDIRKVMDEQKILIINLSKGRIGEQNTSLLGSMIITKIYLAAMSRAEVSADRSKGLPNFYFYVDEFQSFANETFADILAEARKYKLALIIAHQYVAQMEEKVRDAVFGNVGTTISFRVGPLDAELLEKVFAPQFTQGDLINLGMAQIYLTLMINDIGSQPFSARTLPPLLRPQITYRNDVIENSRKMYAFPREAVENATKEWFLKDADNGSDEGKKKVRIFDDGAKPNYEKKEYKKPFEKTFDKPYEQKPPFEKKKFDQPQPVSTKANIVSVKAPIEKVQDKVHNPFKVAFAEHDELEAVLDEKLVSPELNKILSSLDGDGKKEEFKKDETMLTQNLKPVKVLERGPSEQNKNLLRDALLKANINPSSNPSTPAPALKTSIDIKKSEPAPVPKPLSNSVQGTPPSPEQKKEIDYQKLRKIFEE